MPEPPRRTGSGAGGCVSQQTWPPPAQSSRREWDPTQNQERPKDVAQGCWASEEPQEASLGGPVLLLEHGLCHLNGNWKQPHEGALTRISRLREGPGESGDRGPRGYPLSGIAGPAESLPSAFVLSPAFPARRKQAPRLLLLQRKQFRRWVGSLPWGTSPHSRQPEVFKWKPGGRGSGYLSGVGDPGWPPGKQDRAASGSHWETGLVPSDGPLSIVT